MFVLKSTHEKVVSALAEAKNETRKMISEYNIVFKKYEALRKTHQTLVKHINAKGGDDWLHNAVLPSSIKSTPQFSQDEIRQLITLCHPDKHGGRQIATTLTQKLLSLRK